MMVVVVYRWLQILTFREQTKLIIDWHNYGYTIMEANKVNGKLCAMAKIYEGFFGRFSNENLTVSKAFRMDISKQFGIPLKNISVLYDRAVAGKFKVLTLKEKHELFGRIEFEGVFTTEKDGKIEQKPDRPLLLLTSTSYTPDEDIQLLIDALEAYCKNPKPLPNIILVVTGAGPLKKLFLQKFKEFNEQVGKTKVNIQAKWLEIDNYPKMVAAADLGVCMHMSSSNLDLPMKIVDMFSSKLPCFAYNYPTIGELVHSNENSQKPNGALFKTSDDLHKLLIEHFSQGVQKSIDGLEKYRDNLDKFMDETWDDHWQDIMLYQKRGSLFSDYGIIKK